MPSARGSGGGAPLGRAGHPNLVISDERDIHGDEKRREEKRREGAPLGRDGHRRSSCGALGSRGSRTNDAGRTGGDNLFRLVRSGRGIRERRSIPFMGGGIRERRCADCSIARACQRRGTPTQRQRTVTVVAAAGAVGRAAWPRWRDGQAACPSCLHVPPALALPLDTVRPDPSEHLVTYRAVSNSIPPIV